MAVSKLHVERASEAPDPACFDQHAEMATLSAMLNDPGAASVAIVGVQLTVGDFHDPDLGALYDCIRALADAGTPVDPITTTDHLRNRSPVEWTDWKTLVGHLYDVVPTSMHIEEHARIVKRWAQHRCAAAKARDVLRRIEHGGGSPVADLAPDLRALADDIEATPARAEPLYHTLRELRERPELLRAPEAVIPLVGYRGRTTLVVGREKVAGKSTFLGAGAAKCSAGAPFLGHETRKSRVLLVDLEEHLSDPLQRLLGFGADVDNVAICPRTPNSLDTVAKMIKSFSPDVVIIDSLTQITPGMQNRSGGEEWQPVMDRLNSFARDHNIAVVIIHHANKSTGESRDSTVITAAVDMILTLRPGESANVRQITPQGRWTLGSYAVRYEAGEFSLVGVEAPLPLRVLEFVRTHPLCGKRAIRDGVSGRQADVDAALLDLQHSGLVVNDGNNAKHAWRVSETPGHAPDTPRDTPNVNRVSRYNTTRDTLRDTAPIVSSLTPLKGSEDTDTGAWSAQ